MFKWNYVRSLLFRFHLTIKWKLKHDNKLPLPFLFGSGLFEFAKLRRNPIFPFSETPSHVPPDLLSSRSRPSLMGLPYRNEERAPVVIKLNDQLKHTHIYQTEMTVSIKLLY